MDNKGRWRDEIQALVVRCQSARAAGASSEQLRTIILTEAIDSTLSCLDAREFLDWIKDDREYAYFYFDAQQSGVCAKPREVAALILEQIAMDAVE
jgi:hypothetical protein